MFVIDAASIKRVSDTSVLRRYYAFQFFFGQLLWIPIFYEIQKRMGLDDAQIFGINSLYQVAFCLLEIPTGMFADVWGRRRCLFLGGVSLVVAHTLPFLLPAYAGILGLWLLLALARSFISGASSAYLYDYLREQGRSDFYREAEGRARAFSLVGRIAGWACIGWVMEWKLLAPYALTGLMGFFALICALTLPALQMESTEFVRAQRESDLKLKPLHGKIGWRQALQRLELARAVKSLKGSPQLIFLMFQGIGLFILARLQLEIFQPVLEHKGFSATYYGTLLAAVSLLEMLGASRPSWIRRWFTDLNAVYFMTLIMGGLMFLVPWIGPWATILALAIFSFFVGVAFPVQRQLVNDAIRESRFRATLLSLESILDRACHAVLAFQVGAFLTRGQLSLFLMLLGMGSVVFVTVVKLTGMMMRRAELLSTRD